MNRKIEFSPPDITDDEIAEVVDTLTIKILVNYNIQQRYIKDKNIRNEFIDKTFSYFEKNIFSVGG